MKPLAPYFIVFAALLVLAWLLGTSDPITPVVAEARAETGVGPVAMEVIDQSMSFVLKLVFGALITSLIGFGAVEGSKWYRRYVFEQNTRRFRSPGRAPQQTPQPSPRASVPRISRDDVLMALLGLQAPKVKRRQEANDEIELDL